MQSDFLVEGHFEPPHGGIPQNHAKLDIPWQKPQAMLLPSKLSRLLRQTVFETGFPKR